MLLHEDITHDIIGAAIEVHLQLGPGLLESTYRRCLIFELGRRGRRVQEEVTMDLEYKGHRVPCCYGLDLLVDDVVIVEAKAVDLLLPIHKAQLMTYLRLSGRRVGLLLNFKSSRIIHAMERIVL